ncbi:MAG: hypothetical protein IJQ23_02125 [Clostridia bacterium]|nr:hypothetical protein [Clostridia bacterium]MBR0189167.1 hypothetical protein [Clostridia bacterium]
MDIIKKLIDSYKRKEIEIVLECNGISYDTGFDYTQDCIMAKSTINEGQEIVCRENDLIKYVAEKLIKITITIKKL